MKLTKGLTPKHQDKLIELYDSAFPPLERLPLELLRQLEGDDKCDIMAIVQEQECVGLAITYLDDKTPLLAYFAIDSHFRGQGYGSQAIQALIDHYGDLMLEIESTEDPQADNPDQRIRRKAFYLRNNLMALPFTVNYFGLDMEIMSTDPQVSFKDYYLIYERVLSPEGASKNIGLKSN